MVIVMNRKRKSKVCTYVIRFYELETNELLAEEDIRETSYENVEQYAENFIADGLDAETTYFEIS